MTAVDPTLALFGNPAAVACERAASELRSGRAVTICDALGARTAVLAVDGATPATYAAFSAMANGKAALSLSPTRARLLGLTAQDGARVELGIQPFESLAALSYLPVERAYSGAWSHASERDGGGLKIARLGLLLPALLVQDFPRDSNRFEGCVQVSLSQIESAAAHAGQNWEIVARTHVPLRELGDAQFVVFRGGVAQRDQVAIIIGTPDFSQPTPVRVHSSCLTGDLFGSLKCDCGDQLRNGLHKLAELGGGVLLYMDQEGRGTGIAAKMRAYGYQHEGLDTIDADALLGFGPDERRYDGAAAMLRGLGVGQVRLLSNNPAKVERLRAVGVEVIDRIPVTGRITADNEQYLRTKASRAGHALDVDALIASLS